MKRGGRLRPLTFIPILAVLLLAGCSQFSIYDQFKSITSPTSTVGLQLSPGTTGLLVGGTEFFTASGGVSPYTFSVLSGGAGGTINSSTGAYSAPSSAGKDTVQVKDANGNIANATVTVVGVAALVISPATVALNAGNSYQFHASGGVPPYTFSLISGSVGTISSSTGVYTFPSTATSSSTASVTVTDSIGVTASSAQITDATSSTLAVSPASGSVPEGGNFVFVATGGTSPYTASLTPASGASASVSGQEIIAATSLSGSYSVKVKDSTGTTTTVTLAVTPSPPTNLAATAGSGGVANLTWTNNSASATNLYVQRAVGTGSYSTVASFSTTTGPLPAAYQDTGLSSGTVYAYRIETVFVGSSTQQSYSNESVIVAQ